MGQAVSSGVWVAMINVFDRALRIGLLVVLANLLDPADFGLMGIGLLVLSILRKFSEIGINKALVQREEENVDHYLDTAWTMQIVRGVVIGAIMFVLAPFGAEFFNEPRTVDVIRVLSLAPVVRGFRNPGIVYLQKNLDFDKRFVYVMSGAVSNVSVAIGFALVFGNVWALVFGLLADRGVKLVTSYLLHDYRPGLGFRRTAAGEVLDFGKWIVASSLLQFATLQGDDVFVGWFLGAGALGLYQMAYRFSNAPTTEITQVISSVAFPAYSKIQGDEQKLREGFFTTLQLTALISLPLTVGIIVVAPLFVRTFLGSEWVPMILAMQILTVHGGLRSLAASFGPLFEAIGRPDYNTKVSVASLVLLAILIYPLTDQFGIMGTAAAVVGVSVLFPLPVYLVLRSVNGSAWRFVWIVGFPALGSLIMGVCVHVLSRQLDLGIPELEFAILVVVGVIVYTVVMLVGDRQFEYGIEDLFRSMVENVQ